MAAPTVSLYVPTVSATRMAPCPVSARVDFGAVNKSIRNANYTWASVNSGDTAGPYQVSADNLDGFETIDQSVQWFTGASFSLAAWVDIWRDNSDSVRTVGMWIFDGVTVPSGKAIVDAYMEVYGGNSGGAIQGTAYCEDVDNSADFSTTADIVNRTRTTANVSVTVPTTNNTWLTIPDLAPIIQERYDRSGELDATNVGIILEAPTGGSQLGRSNAYPNSEGSSFTAKLYIEYADAPLLDEYKLGTTLANLTDSGTTPTNIIVRENGSIMPEGTVGSLASGEWGQSGGELYVRLSDDADPESKATDYLDITFDVTLSGQGGSTNVGGSSPGWTSSTGSEYTLDTAVDQLAASVPNHCRLRLKEGSGLSGAHLDRGAAGSLAAGEFDIVGETLHVRLSDSSNPDSASASDVVLEYELYPSALHIAWEVNSSGSGVGNWGSRYRYSTDPRSETSSQQIDHAGKQSSGNGPCGMGYVWCFDVADTYTISATVTNTDGDATTETSSGIDVAADSRTYYTVGSGQDYASVVAAVADLTGTDDIGLTVDDGHTENATAGQIISDDNWRIHTETTSGTKPVLTYSDATDTGFVDFFDITGENFVSERIALAESTGNTGNGTGGTIAINGWNVTGINSAFIEGEIQGDASTYRLYSGYVTDGCVGMLVLNCETEYTYGYSVIRGNTTSADTVAVLGCTFGPSSNESVIRILGGTVYFTVAWNDITGDQSKSNIRVFGGRWGTIYGNSGVDGDNWVGSQLATTIAVRNMRIESNKFTGIISAAGILAGIIQGVDGVFACNNLAKSTADAYLSLGNNLEEESSGEGYKKRGISLSHNTIVGEDGFAGEDFLLGGTTNGQIYHGRNRVVNNLFVHEDPADKTGYFVDVGTGIATYTGNVWPATQTNLTAFAHIYTGVNGSGGAYTGSPADLSAWNALSFVGTDTETDVTLDADLIPDSPTTVTTEPGVHYDYFGNARDSTSYAGAVIAANPSSGGTNRNLLLLGVG